MFFCSDDYYHRSISGEEDSDSDDPGPDDCFDGGWRSQAGSGAKNPDPGSPTARLAPCTQTHSFVFGVSWIITGPFYSAISLWLLL